VVDCSAFTSDALELPVALVSGVVLVDGVADWLALASGVVLVDGVVDWLALASGVVDGVADWLALASGVVLVDGVVEDCELISVLLVLGVVEAALPAELSGVVPAVLPGVAAVLDSGVAGVVDWLLAFGSGVVAVLDVVEDCELISVLLVLGVVLPDGVAGTELCCPGSVGVSERVVGSVFVAATLGAAVGSDCEPDDAACC
jgi:hypothetical protein